MSRNNPSGNGDSCPDYRQGQRRAHIAMFTAAVAIVAISIVGARAEQDGSSVTASITQMGPGHDSKSLDNTASQQLLKDVKDLNKNQAVGDVQCGPLSGPSYDLRFTDPDLAVTVFTSESGNCEEVNSGNYLYVASNKFIKDFVHIEQS